MKFYAFLSNGLTSALEKDGRIEWFPAPRYDSPSIFTQLLDPEGGWFSVFPQDTDYVVSSEYLEDSLILRTRFKTKRGQLELVDFLPLSLPAIIRIYNSEIPFISEIKPFFDYGLIRPSIVPHERGIIFRNPRSQEGVELELKGDYNVDEDKIRFGPGKGYLYLLYSKDLRYGLFSKKGEVYSMPYEALERTFTFWKNLINRSRTIEKTKKFEQLYRRSLSVILGLMYFPTGGLIASPTTSLPEIVGESRNWDYRYVWVRDASYGTEALIMAGLLGRARHVLNFLSSVVDPSSKSFDHPFYGIDGTSPPEEQELEWLRGFQNSRPVRIGNGAYMQIQNDIEGAYMHSLHLYYTESRDKQFILDNWWVIEAIAEWVSDSWYRKSTDIWEQRGVSEHFVHTKVMNWVAVDRASKLAQEMGVQEWKEWSRVAEQIRDSVMEEGYSKELNTFVKYYGSQDVDSALLLLPLYDFIKADDPRFLGTLQRIERELTVSPGLFLRYKGDFMGDAQNPFTLVTLWMARVYIRLGRFEETLAMLDLIQSCATDLLLLGEHVERETCFPRGNFPHLFPTSGVVTTILELEEALQRKQIGTR